MTVAYLIASHVNEAQVTRLVARIRAERPHAPIVVHHDADSEPARFDELAGDPHLRFVQPSMHAEWGTFALMDVALAGIDTLLAWGVPFDYVAFISGQDYPLMPLARFEASLTGDGAIAMDDDRPRSLDRYRFRYVRLPRRFESRTMHRIFFVLQEFARFQPFLRFTTGRIGCRIGVRTGREARIRGIRVFKGFTWWTLSRAAATYVRDFARARPDVTEIFAHRTLNPDEAFFQTILATRPFALTNDDGRFVRWPSANAMNPVLLTSTDFDELIASGKPFARKFDTRCDATILDRLDVASLGRALPTK